jgi:Zn-dependent alcohol dehydrogenase
MVQLFGQSSFAQRTIARRSSVVNVNAFLHHDNELQLLTPLGCGLQTGKGTTQNIASAGPAGSHDPMPMRAVGMGALMVRVYSSNFADPEPW